MTLLLILLFILALIAATFLDALILQLIVNWVLGLFGLAFSLTYWQAFGVTILLTLIGGYFKNIGGNKN